MRGKRYSKHGAVKTGSLLAMTKFRQVRSANAVSRGNH
jgi:hypothetical protein